MPYMKLAYRQLSLSLRNTQLQRIKKMCFLNKLQFNENSVFVEKKQTLELVKKVK